MGVIAAALGMGLAAAEQGAAADVAFYAANHVLVKAALFLTVGVVAARDGRARSLALIVAALLALSLAGLPLTGGSLAKLAVKDLFGDAAAGMAAQLSAVATAALMLHFVYAASHARPETGGAASPRRLGHGRRWRSPRCFVPWLSSRPSAVRPRRSNRRSSGTRSGRCGRRRARPRAYGREGSASPRSRGRHPRRRGGRVPRPRPARRTRLRAGRPGACAAVARGGHCRRADVSR